LQAPEIFIVDAVQHTIIMEEISNGRTLKQKIKELEGTKNPEDELKQIASNLGHIIGILIAKCNNSLHFYSNNYF
jgi:tRNA A-37 threonylcarbamoyl transferase component Bud32